MGLPVNGTDQTGSAPNYPAVGIAGIDANGKIQRPLIDANGGLFTSASAARAAGQAPSNAGVAAYAASLVVKASAGILYGITIYNSKAGAQWIQIHNTTTLPADTAVPVISLVVATVANLVIEFGSYGKAFTTGITICNSTTGPTKTIGAADCWIEARYV